jgi:hypothetical protein
LVFFEDEVYSLSLGSNGLIITKKILFGIGLLGLVMLVLMVKVSNAYADVQWTDLTWEQFSR